MAFGIDDALAFAPMVLSLFAGRPKHDASQQVPQNDALTQLLAMQKSRMTQTDPLYQAILKMAMGMMPVSARPPMPGQRPAGFPGGGGMAMNRERPMLGAHLDARPSRFGEDASGTPFFGGGR